MSPGGASRGRSVRRDLLRRGGAGLVLGLAVLGWSAPASAAPGSWVSARDAATGQSVKGQTVSDDTTIRVRGTGTQTGQDYTLEVSEPDGTEYGEDSAQADLTGPARTRVDVTTADEPNGEWTATLTGGGSADFTLAVPPAQVTGFAAHGDDSGVRLRWSANPEPDLVGYVVGLPDGENRTYSPGQAHCASNPACALTYRPAAGEAGQTVRFTITAERNGACGCAAEPLSGPPARASADLSEPATPGPANSGPGTGNSTGASPGSGGHGGSASSGRVRQGGHAAGGKRQALPPGVHTEAPASANRGSGRSTRLLPGGTGSGAARQQGGYRSTLAYPGHGTPGSAFTGDRAGNPLTSGFDPATLWRSLGAAAVLLLAGGHLLFWLRRDPVEL